VYEGDVRVPLGVHGLDAPGLTLATVPTIDVARTLVAWLGLNGELASDGEDLREWARGGAGGEAYSEASMPWNVEVAGAYPNAQKQRAVRTSTWSFVETPWRNQQEWFSRAKDPGELRESLPETEPLPAALIERLRSWSGRGAPRAQPSYLSESVRERLRSIGYVDGTP
jgi:arylsulfatase A-like enzyme